MKRKSEERAEDYSGKDHTERLSRLFLHKKSGEIYRVVGSCINKDTDEFTTLYRKWNDFGNAVESLYCREYHKFNEAFEYYSGDLELIPTPEQCLKQYEKKAKTRRK